MHTDPRLQRLVDATSELAATRISDVAATIGDLGLDSQSLAEFLVVCEDIYGDAVDMNEVNLDYEVSLNEIHLQIVRQLDQAGAEHRSRN
ncbi:MAG: hypothetical protein JOY71_24860 [Acetobacteraceae bacterium]|nr:hypothetical protein [Acetobacteraceae bacterium]MBV8525312.1 hypothetical protein [Acetobacteraceae bacterium]